MRIIGKQLVVAFASAVRPFRKPGAETVRQMPGLLRQEAGRGGGVAGVLLVAERDHAHALGLRHAREVGDRNAGQAEDRVDAVQLQRVDDEVEAVDGRGGRRPFLGPGLGDLRARSRRNPSR